MARKDRFTLKDLFSETFRGNSRMDSRRLKGFGPTRTRSVGRIKERAKMFRHCDRWQKSTFDHKTDYINIDSIIRAILNKLAEHHQRSMQQWLRTTVLDEMMHIIGSADRPRESSYTATILREVRLTFEAPRNRSLLTTGIDTNFFHLCKIFSPSKSTSRRTRYNHKFQGRKIRMDQSRIRDAPWTARAHRFGFPLGLNEAIGRLLLDPDIFNRCTRERKRGQSGEVKAETPLQGKIIAAISLKTHCEARSGLSKPRKKDNSWGFRAALNEKGSAEMRKAKKKLEDFMAKQ
ncbi:hypothetical protein KM043_010698 [Ampulex compressa]|nr:hypothetical protein KM043_010698 [Ampulex compressa]